MKAFVLAAGFGTRLKPLTDTMPKPLVPILNVPSICYTLFLLKEAGIGTAIINIHHHAEEIRRFFERHEFGDIEIVLSEEKTILGTGGGLKKCEHLLDDDEFLLINSDIISDLDLAALIRTHRQNGAGGTLALFETPKAREIGEVGIRDGRVVDFRNMRDTGTFSQLIYTGTAVLGPRIFRYLSEEFSSIVDTGFTGLIDNEGLGNFVHRGLWQDIGTFDSFVGANLDGNTPILRLAERMEHRIGIRPCMLRDDASISPAARVRASVIGAGCSVGPDAVVEHSVVLPGTVIDAASTVRNSIVWPGGSVTR